jgi:hypothetical protein
VGQFDGWVVEVSDVIWRSTVDFRPPRAIFGQRRAWCAKFGAFHQRLYAFAYSAFVVLQHGI